MQQNNRQTMQQNNRRNMNAQQQPPRRPYQDMPSDLYSYEPDNIQTQDKGHGLTIAIIIEVALLLMLIAGGAMLVLSAQPTPSLNTMMTNQNGRAMLEVNDIMLSEEEQAALNAQMNPQPAAIRMPVDKVLLPYGGEGAVREPGKISVCQIVGTQRVPVTEIEGVLPNTPLEITEMSDKLIQNGTYEIRMAQPILMENGERLSFHAYLIDYRWERSEYLRNMEPSVHDLYVLADGEEPDYAELIQSGVAERTKNDTTAKGDTLVEINKNKNTNANSNSNANSNGNANSNANENANIDANENSTGNSNTPTDNGNTTTDNTANANNTNANANKNSNNTSTQT